MVAQVYRSHAWVDGDTDPSNHRFYAGKPSRETWPIGMYEMVMESGRGWDFQQSMPEEPIKLKSRLIT
jgi:hypothetical protein